MHFEALQRFVQFRKTRHRGWADQHSFVERDMLRGPASFLAFPCLGIVHQNVSHHTGCDCVKVNSVPPVATSIREPQIRFMHQSRRTQSVVGAFRPQAAGSQPSKLIVDQWN
jgi:hypothetical protein